MRVSATTPILAVVALCATVAAWQVAPIAGAIVGCLSLGLLCVITSNLASKSQADAVVQAVPEPVPATHVEVEATSETSEAAPKDLQMAPANEDPPSSEPEDEAPAELPPAQSSENDAAIEIPSAPMKSEPATPAPIFSFDRFRRSLLLSEDPIASLRSFVDTVHKREKQLESDNGNDPDLPGLSDAERFLARRLEEAGIYTTDKDEELPALRVVWPFHSQTFYLRAETTALPYGVYLRVVRIEAALNVIRFAFAHYEDLATVGIDELYRFAQRMTTTVCAQANSIDTADWSYLAMPWQAPIGPSDQGEWAVRHGISEAIETVQVPYRLEARFRSNVAAGNVAMELKVTPARAFPKSAYVDGLGIVPTTAHMRMREASKYAARMGILLASKAFCTSKRIRRVWIAAVEETPTRHNCLYSVCFDRKVFSRIRLDAIPHPLATLRSFGATMSEDKGVLEPTQQSFYLEDERFCPPMRHDLWELSERALPASAALSLGTTRVSGLTIHEELPRIIVADSMLRELPNPTDSSATQTSVHAILEAAHNTSDIGVWSAAERVAGKLVDGSLELGDMEALREEMINGDALSKAVDQAHRLLSEQNAHSAMRILLDALDQIDRHGRYDDTQAVVYRCFDSFAERVLYNRLNARDHRSVVLVPDAYLMAHLMLSALLVALPDEQGGDGTRASWHAERALAVAPLNPSAHLGMVACLEQAGKIDEACGQIRSLLEVAYSPSSIGLAYYRMAALQAKLGNQEACQACYQRSVRLIPQLLPMVYLECQILAAGGFSFEEDMDEKRVDDLLDKHGIPAAPSAQTSFILYDGATASIDAEVFPVARDLMRVIQSFSGDDVLRGISNSLEFEPDA